MQVLNNNHHLPSSDNTLTNTIENRSLTNQEIYSKINGKDAVKVITVKYKNFMLNQQ